MAIRPPGFTPAPVVNICLNIGACLDIPTGDYLFGKHGESILNGGLQPITGYVGIGNCFKSTFMHYGIMTAMARIYESTPTWCSIYDTEMNIREERLAKLAYQNKTLHDAQVFKQDETGFSMYQITNKTKHMGDEWYDILKEHLRGKKDNKEYLVRTPFLDRDGVSFMPIYLPTFGAVDSIVHFEDSKSQKMLEDNSLGDSEQNTYWMKTGNVKSKLFADLPTLLNGTYHFMGIVAQLGDVIEIPTGPVKKPPKKDLQFLPPDKAIKGATKHFTYLLQNGWLLSNAKPLLDKQRDPEFPSSVAMPGNKVDLMSIDAQQLRGKGGHTGFTETIIVSQNDGILPTLTEFNRIRDFDYYGLMGSKINYHVALYPKVKMTRNTVREKIEQDARLRRAINIVSEMSQIVDYKYEQYADLLCTPQDLYDDLKNLGYDWDVLLDTRGYWTLNNDTHPVPFLSTMDLLRMRKGLYRPYWMK